MLTTYNLKMPHAVYGGENAMDNITAILKTNGVKRVAMFTDKGIEAAGLFTLCEEAVKAAEADYYVLDDLPAEPSYMAVQKLVDEFKASGADIIVACGGGSVMDAAKLASVLVTDEYGGAGLSVLIMVSLALDSEIWCRSINVRMRTSSSPVINTVTTWGKSARA